MSVAKAKIVLSVYFQTTFEAAGLEWTDENQAEIEELIDLILLAAEAQTEDNYVEHE